MGWTDEQKKAIESKDCKLLVAAAAGSGKTAVLIERILSSIIPEDKSEAIDVDRMLVVTFTRAAAAEMRERIQNGIQQRLDNGDDVEAMLRQLNLLPSASISTIDSFCQKVIQENYTESGYDITMRIAEPGECGILKKNAVEAVLERRYEETGDSKRGLERLIDTYASYRGDEGLADLIINIHDFIQSETDPLGWLEQQRRALDPCNMKDFAHTEWGRELMEDISLKLQGFAESLKNAALYGDKIISLVCNNNYYDFLMSEAESIDKVRREYFTRENKTFDPQPLKNIVFQTLPRVNIPGEETEAISARELIKKLRDNIKGELKKIISLVSLAEEGSVAGQGEKIFPDIGLLLDLVIEFDGEYKKIKLNRHVCDYSDLEHSAYKILQKENIREIYRQKYVRVFVDEYQDTNKLQEGIIKCVTREENSDIFMVGDVKQSIYGFRQADPELFLEKYGTYSLEDDSKEKLIRLYTNFRSRKTVLNGINHIFAKIMRKETGKMDYTRDEYLKYGGTYYDETGKEDCLNEFVAFKDQDRESEWVADNILNTVSSGFTVFDKRTGGTKPVSYGDIVILMRSPKSGDGYKAFVNSLEKRNIPVSFSQNKGLFNGVEVNMLLAFLKMVNNPLNDVPVASVLRNFYGFTDEELSDISLITNKIPLIEKIRLYALEGTDEALKGRLVSFTDELDLLRSEAPNMKVSQIIWYAFNLNGFYDKVGLMENGEGRQRNMMLLFDKANKYCGNSSGLAGLFSFLTMVENMQKRGEDMEVASDTQNDDKVKIMSIHSSKGLEFPIVYLVGTHKKFRFRDGIGSSINLHKRLGLGPLCYDPEERKIYNSIFNKILDITKRGETVAEEMRLLYVALTRAREKLIVTGCVKEDLDVYINSQLLLYDADKGQPLVSGVREATSYFQWITLALALDPGECWQLKAIDNEENEDVEENKRGEGVDFTRYNMEKVIPDNIERKSPVMPVPLKMSVSEYKRLNSREEEYNEARPLYPSSNKGLSAAEMGTLVHLCLQHTDYQELKRVMDQNDDANVSADEYFYTLINRLEAQEYIKKDEKEAIDKQVITSFYTSDFCKMIMDSENIQKEIPFMFLRKWRTVAPKQEEYTEEELNRDVIIQGVIDCCFEYEGQVILLDFKTDFIYTTLDVIAERYRPQLECYWEAIARAYGKPPAHVYVYFLKAGQHYEYDMSYMGI